MKYSLLAVYDRAGIGGGVGALPLHHRPPHGPRKSPMVSLAPGEGLARTRAWIARGQTDRVISEPRPDGNIIPYKLDVTSTNSEVVPSAPSLSDQGTRKGTNHADRSCPKTVSSLRQSHGCALRILMYQIYWTSTKLRNPGCCVAEFSRARITGVPHSKETPPP